MSLAADPTYMQQMMAFMAPPTTSAMQPAASSAPSVRSLDVRSSSIIDYPLQAHASRHRSTQNAADAGAAARPQMVNYPQVSPKLIECFMRN